VETIILAGGFGTRLQSVVNHVAKSMALINNRPFLEYQLDYLIRQGTDKVVLAVGYKYESIQDHFGDRYRSVDISYSVEKEPLGTGGGIRLAFWKIDGPRALVLNGDSLFRLDYPALQDLHLKRKADVTLALRRMENTGRYGRILLNRNHRIIQFAEKNESAGPGLINGGVYIIEKTFLMEPCYRGKFSLEKDCFERCYGNSKMYGFPSDGYFLDIGIPEDYEKAQHEFAQFEG
jgi:D-glycero-alpha-D-manno-heptose 1-phosphate guanylyltransferase